MQVPTCQCGSPLHALVTGEWGMRGPVCRNDEMVVIHLDPASHRILKGATALQLLQTCNQTPQAHVLQNLLPTRTDEAFGEVFPYCF